MDWTDIGIGVAQADAEVAEAIVTGISSAGVYIEDYADLEEQAPKIAHVDFFDENLLQKPKDRVIVHFYLSPETDVSSVLALLQERLAAAGILYTLLQQNLSEENWATNWKNYYHSFPVGSRLLLCPAWEKDLLQPGERVPLLLDPGMAFGTGTHETTYLCLEFADRLIQGGERVLDIGCGSGILAIAGCLLGAGEALGIDIDPVAVRTSRENALLNHVSERFTAVQGNLSEQAKGRYDIIFANIVANAILSLSPEIPALLSQNGLFIASGIINEREQEVANKLLACGLCIVETARKNGWVCILAKAAC